MKSMKSMDVVNAVEAGDLEYLTRLLSSAIMRERMNEGYYPLEDYTDANGDTALTMAFDRGLVEIAELVVAACVNPDPRNRRHPTDPFFRVYPRALEVAAEQGHHGFVQTLLSSTASFDPDFATLLLQSNPYYVDCRSDFGIALLLAAKNGHARTVEALLAAGADVERTTLHGDAALAVAAKGNHATVVDLLVTAGAKINAAGRDGNTALTFAVMGGHAGIVRKLLDYGAEFGRTELVQAACGGYKDIEAMLLAVHGTVRDCNGCTASVVHGIRCRRYETRFRVDDCQDVHGNTALFTAVRNGIADVVEMLLNAGADIDQVDGRGFSPLQVAVNQGDLDLAQRLILRRTSAKHTALMVASAAGYCRIVDALLAAGASADHESLLRAIKNGQARVVDTLLAAGAPVDVSGHLDGPVAIAASRGDTAIVEMLLAAGASVDSAGANGLTPLMAAAACGNVSMIETLLAAGADTWIATSRCGMTAFAFAAKGGHLPAVKKLVHHAKMIDSLEEDASCALVHAAWGGHLEVVDLLLAAGVDGSQTELFGRSALMAAVECGAGAVVDRLLAAGTADRNPKLLIVAAERGYEDVVDKLLAAGVSPRLPSRNCGRRSALYRAVATGRVAIVKKLLAGGAPFRRESGEQISVFLKACKTGRVDVVQVLMDTGGLFDQSDARWSSIRSSHDLYVHPVHIAAERDDVELLELLLARGADVNAPRRGRTPLDSASCKGALSAVGGLLAHGHKPRDIHDMDDFLKDAAYDAVHAGIRAFACELLAQKRGLR